MFVKVVEEVVKQQMVMNGQVNEWDEHVCSLCCGKCGLPFIRVGSAITDGYRALLKDKDNLSKQFKYCPSCGEKFDFDIVVDLPATECKVVTEEPNNEKEPE